MNTHNNGSDDGNGDKPGPTKVGHKRPPRHTRFKRGQSGNPKGRPKENPNFANLMQKAFNTTVPVKTGDETVHMTSGEAILRVLMKLAHQGKRPARSAYFEILKMTGRTADISDAERERRMLKLPVPHSRDVFDLLISPALEGERHRLLARYEAEEAKGCAPQWDPKFIEGAPKPNHVRQAINPGWREPDPEVLRLGLRAHERCFAGDFNEALSSADQAIAQAGDYNVTWIQLVRAHACMMVGRIEEARDFYLQFPTDSGFGTCWQNVIIQDFGNLRTSGHFNALMVEIEQKLGEQGWTAADKPTTAKAKQRLSQEDREFMVMHPDDIKTGALLEQDGDLDKAANLYRRSITKCRSRLAKNKSDSDAKQTLETATDRLIMLAHRLLLAGGFGQASEFINELLAVTSDSLRLQALRAQLLMFSGQGKEAYNIFLQHRGKKIGSETWEAATLKDFEAYRKAGRSHALMDEIEQLIGNGCAKQPSEILQSPSPQEVEPDLSEADDVQSGEKLFEQGRHKEALAVYLRHLDGWHLRRSRGVQFINQAAIANRNIAVDNICDLALIMILNREFTAACDAAQRALAALDQAPRANICLAHGLMFLGQVDDARRLYKNCWHQRLDAEKKGSEVILRDFAAIRDAGLIHDLMNEIEKNPGTPPPAARRLIA